MQLDLEKAEDNLTYKSSQREQLVIMVKDTVTTMSMTPLLISFMAKKHRKNERDTHLNNLAMDISF